MTVLVMLGSLNASARANSVNSSYAADGGVSGLKWKGTTIPIAVSSSLFYANYNIKSDSDVDGALSRSLAAWSRVANIDFAETPTDKLNASPVGGAGDGISLITNAPTAENALLFQKDPDIVAATTRVFYNGRGQITEADIVLNPYQQFSTDGTIGTFDLESTLTHEIGHLLGLDHSPILGATMHDNYGKNGLYGLQSFGVRSLGAADIAAARAIYGARQEDSECCGRIAGKILSSTGRPVKGAVVWLEDVKTGAVFGGTQTSADGSYKFAGLASGTFKVQAQSGAGARTGFSTQDLGEAVVDKNETLLPAKRISPAPGGIELSYIGFNGQLSDLPVPLSAGRTYIVYLGGRNLDPKRITFGFDSPFLSVVPNSVNTPDFGDEISVVSFEVRVDPKTPTGEYSIFAASEKGQRQVLAGAFTVDKSGNNFSRSVLAKD